MVFFQRNSTTFKHLTQYNMKDYIDNYINAVREAGEEGDVNIVTSKTFYSNARRDFSSAKRKGLIQDMSYEDYLDATYKEPVKVSDEMKRIILFKPYFSATLISKQYKMHYSTIVRIRKLSEESQD